MHFKGIQREFPLPRIADIKGVRAACGRDRGVKEDVARLDADRQT